MKLNNSYDVYDFIITLTRSRLQPVILRDWLPTVTVYLYSPMLASLVERLCRRDERKRELCC